MRSHVKECRVSYSNPSHQRVSVPHRIWMRATLAFIWPRPNEWHSHVALKKFREAMEALLGKYAAYPLIMQSERQTLILRFGLTGLTGGLFCDPHFRNGLQKQK